MKCGFGALVEELGADVGVADRLVRYLEVLERWAGTHNLVSYRDREELVRLHLADAVAGAPFMSPKGRLLDVGSGGGLPGVPLLAWRGEWSGVLLEPRVKRWAFLCTVIRELDLEAQAVRARYEQLPFDEQRYDLVTARAVGRHGALLRWARGRLSDDGQVFLWMVRDDLEELGDLRGWRVLSSPLPGRDRGVLVRLKKCFT